MERSSVAGADDAAKRGERHRDLFAEPPDRPRSAVIESVSSRPMANTYAANFGDVVKHTVLC